MDDPQVQRIVLAINSPGGQIDGINELANMIRAANQTKQVTAYVDGLAASGAYWLASAAGRIVADETAQLGSIGVLATVVDDRAAEEKHGVKRYEIVSSQSPLKRTDPGTDQGRAQIQQMVDALAAVFIDKVAKFRGTGGAKVERDFGQGAVMPASAAVSVGMADALGSLEELLSLGTRDPVRIVRDQPHLRVRGDADEDGKRGLDSGAPAVPSTSAIEVQAPGDDEPDEDDCDCPPGEDCDCDDTEAAARPTDEEPDEDDALEGDGELIKPNEERQRIAAILNCEEACGREQLARVLALETNHTLDAAKKLLLACPAAAKPAVNALEAHMSQIENPKVGVAADAGLEDTPAAEVARILAFVPKNRRHAVQ